MSTSRLTGGGLQEQVSASRRGVLEWALRRTDWNVTAAAKILRVSRPTVYRWIRIYGLERPAR